MEECTTRIGLGSGGMQDRMEVGLGSGGMQDRKVNEISISYLSYLSYKVLQMKSYLVLITHTTHVSSLHGFSLSTRAKKANIKAIYLPSR